MKLFDGREFDIPKAVQNYAVEHHFRFVDAPFQCGDVTCYPVGVKWRELPNYERDDRFRNCTVDFIVEFPDGKVMFSIPWYSAILKKYKEVSGTNGILYQHGHFREWEEQFDDIQEGDFNES